MRSLSLKLLEMSLLKIGTLTITEQLSQEFTNLNNCDLRVLGFDDNLGAKGSIRPAFFDESAQPLLECAMLIRA